MTAYDTLPVGEYVYVNGKLVPARKHRKPPAKPPRHAPEPKQPEPVKPKKTRKRRPAKPVPRGFPEEEKPEPKPEPESAKIARRLTEATPQTAIELAKNGKPSHTGPAKVTKRGPRGGKQVEEVDLEAIGEDALLELVDGRTLEWTNYFSGTTESARIPKTGEVKPDYALTRSGSTTYKNGHLAITEGPQGRILTFVSKDGGWRAVYVARIERVK